MGEWVEAMAGARSRTPIAPGDSSRSGSRVELAVLADGRTVVAKHLHPTDDLILRATGDDGRLERLWQAGVFERMPPVIEHTIVGVEPEGDGWLVVMEDVGSALLADDRPITRAENRRILGAGAALHGAFHGVALPQLAPIGMLYRFLSSGMAAAERASANPLPGLVGRGWERFGEAVPHEVADSIAAIHGDPDRFAARFEGCSSTLVHGDFRFANMGLRADRLVLIDWGSSCVVGPSALDVAWYLIVGATRIEATRDEVLDDFRAAEGDRFEGRALGLALIGALAQLGWNKALDILENEDEAVRVRERADLDWWVTRVQHELDTLGGI
jgi:hypothetical protein